MIIVLDGLVMFNRPVPLDPERPGIFRKDVQTFLARVFDNKDTRGDGGSASK